MDNLIENMKDFFKTLTLSLVAVLVIYTFIFKPIRIDGLSMYPTLNDGDLGFSGVITKLSGYDRFDIVILKNDKTKNMIVKRVIGMPNEIVEYRDNKLYINNEFVEESFLSNEVFTDNFKIELGEDEYFCLGDNRDISRDSRYYGAFKSGDIVAKDIFVILPIDDFGSK